MFQPVGRILILCFLVSEVKRTTRYIAPAAHDPTGEQRRHPRLVKHESNQSNGRVERVDRLSVESTDEVRHVAEVGARPEYHTVVRIAIQ